MKQTRGCSIRANVDNKIKREIARKTLKIED